MTIDKNYIQLAQLHSIIIQTNWINKDSKDVFESKKCLTRILKNSFDINYGLPANNLLSKHKPEYTGYTLLHFVVQYKLSELVDFLFKNHSLYVPHTIQITNKALNNFTPLRLAFQLMKDFGMMEDLKHNSLYTIVNKLLSAHIDLNIQTNPKCQDMISHFHIACMIDFKFANFFIESGIDINETVDLNSHLFPGFSPLHFAVRYGHSELVHKLLQCGANINQLDGNNRTPLRLLIDYNMQVTDVLRDEATLNKAKLKLKTDCLKKNDQIMEMLMTKINFDSSNLVDDIGFTFLHAACTRQDQDNIEKLLNSGSNINEAIRFDAPLWPGYTPLHFAARCNFQNIMLLLKKGANLAIKDANGMTALDLCINRYTLAEIYCILKINPLGCIRFGNNSSLVDIFSMMDSNANFRKFLTSFELGACVTLDSPVWPGYTLLHLAVLTSNTKKQYNCKYFVIKNYLWEEDISIDSDDSNGICKMYIRKNSDMLFWNASGVTPLQLAIDLSKSQNFCDRLLTNYAASKRWIIPQENLVYLFVMDCPGIIEKLLKNGLNPNWTLQKDEICYCPNNSEKILTLKAGSTLVHIAALAEANKVILECSKIGIKVKVPDADGLTPVQLGFVHCKSKNTIFNLLSIPRAQEINSTTKSNLTHLHIACYAGNIEAIKKLLQVTHNIDDQIICDPSDPYIEFLTKYSGYTPLHFAVQFEYTEIITLLLNKNANILKKNDKGLNPLHLVLQNLKACSIMTEMIKKVINEQNFQNDFGITRLHLAYFIRDQEKGVYNKALLPIKSLIQELLEAGENVNSQIDLDSPIHPGDTPHHLLIKAFPRDQTVPKLLSKYQVDLAIKNADNLTSLQLLSTEEILSFEYQEFQKILLTQDINKFCSITNTNNEGLTHLHISCYLNQLSYVEKCLVSKANVNAIIDPFCKFWAGYTPLHLAVQIGNYQMSVLLLQYGADISVEDIEGLTPLHHIFSKTSCNAKHPFSFIQISVDEMISQSLMKFDFYNCETLGKSVFEKFFENWDQNIDSLNWILDKHNGNINLLKSPFDKILKMQNCCPSSDVIQFLVKKGIELSVKDTYNRNALFMVILSVNMFYDESYFQNSYINSLEALVNAGCELDLRDCDACLCHPLGSLSSSCDLVTGQCQCKSLVIGRQCDRCLPDHWGLSSGGGCSACNCDIVGSYNASCQDATGQCHCKPGVGGLKCDSCLTGYYGFSQDGCQPCEPCHRIGHICDQNTGRCSCPSLSYGDRCDRCRPGSYDYRPGLGCRACSCSSAGSFKQQCGQLDGQCPCREGFEGRRCERCSPGHYDYPHCRPCNCDVLGSLGECDETGQCPCKENVIGRRCNQCSPGTFGLSADSHRGCIECFCFGRTNSCKQAGLSWGQRRLPRPRVLYVNDTVNEVVITNYGSSLVLPYFNSGLNKTNTLYAIPGTDGDVTLPMNFYRECPVYWQLPDFFLRDKITSYGGFLRFTTITEGGYVLRSGHRFPLVQMQGNGIVLEHLYSGSNNDSSYVVRLHESSWQLKNRADIKVNRKIMMVVLQNVQQILVKASDFTDFSTATLLEVSIDTGVLTATHTPALASGIEQCECPNEYNGTSCQDPSKGYYRWLDAVTVNVTNVINSGFNDGLLIELVGKAKPCQCNGRSDNCDLETGHCLNCQENTAGFNCEICAESFYGDPSIGGGCKECPCPQTDKKFSNTCIVRPDNEVVCVCKPGYAGPRCERCAYGHYGYPSTPGGSCEPCRCSPAGSASDECDIETGQCNCRPGSTGRDCSQCTAERHVFVGLQCVSCNDNCTGLLMDDLDDMKYELINATTHISAGYIAPPWEELAFIDDNVTILYEEIVERRQIEERLKNLPWGSYKLLAKQAESLLSNVIEQTNSARSLKSQSGDIQNNAYSLKMELEGLKNDINDTILELAYYGNDDKKVEIKKVLKEATRILNEMKLLDVPKRKTAFEILINECTEYITWLNELILSMEPLTKAKEEAHNFSIKMKDMMKIMENTMETMFTYDATYNEVNMTYEVLSFQQEEIDDLNTKIVGSLDKGQTLVDEARGCILDSESNIQDIPELTNKLLQATNQLSTKEEISYRLNYEYKNKYVVPAIAHAQNLSDYVDQYVGLFSETRAQAANPLKASQAYKNIVEGLIEAKQDAEDANAILDSVNQKVYPDGTDSDSLLDNALDVASRSTEQMERTRDHNQPIMRARGQLETQKQAVADLKDALNTAGNKDNNINVKLRELQADSKKMQEKLGEIMEDNVKTSGSIAETKQLITDYQQGIIDVLNPKLQELKREGDSRISLASEKLAEAQINIKMTDAKLTSLANAAVKRQEEFDKWNGTLAAKIQILKDKIAEARNTADGIRISIKSAEGKRCVRSYRPKDLQPSSTTTISMTFAIPQNQREGVLFYLASSTNDDFMAIEMFDQKIRFVWNVGGGTGIITHPEILEVGNPQDDSLWYRIEAERIRHIGKLTVIKQLTRTSKYSAVINETSSEFGLFDVTAMDRIWLGGFPEPQSRPPDLLSSSGLPGCVHQVFLNGKQIGLWNFLSNAPDNACQPCVEGIEHIGNDLAYSFNGEGYAVRTRVISGPYNKYTFGVSINFRTYDENAIIFLAIDPNDPTGHIMIFLREGRVVLHISYGNNISMEMSSSFRYNTGNWTKVDAFRQYQTRKGTEKCSFSIDGENDKKIGAPTPQPRAEDIPDLSRAKYFIGGVPPSFRVDGFILPTHVSLLGCMSNILVGEGYDPMAEQYYGVEPGCRHKPMRIVGFYGDGYLELPGLQLRKKVSSISFSFRTLQSNAMLLLSTFQGPEERLFGIPDQELLMDNYYSVAVIDGRIQVRINGGKGELVLQSNATFNDGTYHMVTVTKRRKDVELRIDDAYQANKRLASSAAIKAPESGGLYVGGLPHLINNTKMVGTNVPLIGAIKDIIFDDDKLLKFDDAVKFERALLGRHGPRMGKDPPAYSLSASLSRGMSTQPEGCQKIPYYSLEPGALKFGDKPQSHTQLYLNFDNFWHQKKMIEFDFRTYYPNGLLFITPGIRIKNYLAVVIRDGQLLLIIKNKHEKEILFKTPFNDGKWHHVTIGHVGRKLSMIVDTQTPMFVKVPKKIGLTNVMYIGGIPESGTPLPEQIVSKLETLKGCIRGLKVNGNIYDMVGSTSRPYNVGQCFPHVESGAYFQDEAYAVYKKNFELGPILELQLEFRTSELTGVLLSITGSDGTPSLSLELHNGKVVMSSDFGYNQALYVEQEFINPYAVCDNRWHRIQAIYNDEELALKVDDLDQKYGLPAEVNGHLVGSFVTNALYIGGIPASAPKGTLMARDHFNGCIRNVMIGGERRDWTDMSELYNIHLNSCPVQ